MNKTIIFIAGSSYSGSTILDMMMASGAQGFSMGEVNALFYPYRAHHRVPICGCGNPDCRLWQRLNKDKPHQLYHEIFKQFPLLDHIVDSSKDPYWIQDQANAARKQGYTVKHILIWKSPIEFAASQFKRGVSHKWEKSWINYHRLYFALIDNWLSVQYKCLANEPRRTLKKLCQKTKISYFDNKELYWNETHHTLFGNSSAKIHLYNEKENEFQKCANELEALNPRHYKNNYRKIYYDAQKLKKLPGKIHRQIEKNNTMERISDLLKMTDLSGDRTAMNCFETIKERQNEIKFPPHITFLKKIHHRVKQFKNGITYRQPQA